MFSDIGIASVSILVDHSFSYFNSKEAVLAPSCPPLVGTYVVSKTTLDTVTYNFHSMSTHKFSCCAIVDTRPIIKEIFVDVELNNKRALVVEIVSELGFPSQILNCSWFTPVFASKVVLVYALSHALLINSISRGVRNT